MAKDIAELHQGQLILNAREGEFTEIMLPLPLAEKGAPAAQRSRPA